MTPTIGAIPMSKNDVETVEIEFSSWKADRAHGLPVGIEPFEFFIAECLLKDHNFSDEEVLSGVVGSSNDGGCDALFFLVGGKLMQDDSPIPEHRALTVNLVFIQAKEREGFSPLQVDRLEALTDDLLDIERPPNRHRRTYNEKLSGLIRLFKQCYAKLRAPRLVIDYYYVTMADCTPGVDCHTSAAKIAGTVKGHFSRADVHPFHFMSAAHLYTHLFERPSFEKKLQCAELMDGTEGHIGLVTLQDFFGFLRGDDGEIIERIFDDNVRGFQRDTQVNDSILKSLEHPATSPEFWLLNNGITILSPHVERLGGKVFRIVDPQIVNGLQTSRQVFDYFKDAPPIPTSDKRRIVVRVIENSDEKTREAIIKATNNQNPMPAEALYTTSRIHRQIETYFESKDLFYERRKGFWRDKRKPIGKIISAVSLVQAIVAIMMREPDVARGRPRDYINDSTRRYKIFGHDDYDDSTTMAQDVASLRPYDLQVYFKCWLVVRSVGEFLDDPILRLNNESKRNILYYLSCWAACGAIENAYAPPGSIARIDVASLSRNLLTEGLDVTQRIYRRMGQNDEAGKNPRMGDAFRRRLIKRFSPPRAREEHGSPSEQE